MGIACRIAERSDDATLLVGNGLNGERQSDSLPATADTNLGLLLELTGVTDSLGCEGLRTMEVTTLRQIMKRETWKWVLQTLISILTAIATTMGVTSCIGI